MNSLHFGVYPDSVRVRINRSWDDRILVPHFRCTHQSSSIVRIPRLIGYNSAEDAVVHHLSVSRRHRRRSYTLWVREGCIFLCFIFTPSPKWLKPYPLSKLFIDGRNQMYDVVKFSSNVVDNLNVYFRCYFHVISLFFFYSTVKSWVDSN